MFEITVTPEQAHKVAEWIENRGGAAVWQSVNLSNPGATWTTPYLSEDGTKYGKPNWQCDHSPDLIIKNPDSVGVVRFALARRFRVGVRLGSNGLSWKVTDGGTRHIRSAMAREAEKIDAELRDYVTYTFDYETQEALILVPESVISLTEFVGREA